MKIDFKKVTAIRFGGIDHKDYPKYCDAYITSCLYDGREPTDEEWDAIESNSDFVYEELMNYLH